jgi:hypothetical protein
MSRCRHEQRRGATSGQTEQGHDRRPTADGRSNRQAAVAYPSTPIAVAAPAWRLCSTTGSAAVLKDGSLHGTAGYFRIARNRQSVSVLSLVVRTRSEISRGGVSAPPGGAAVSGRALGHGRGCDFLTSRARGKGISSPALGAAEKPRLATAIPLADTASGARIRRSLASTLDFACRAFLELTRIAANVPRSDFSNR